MASEEARFALCRGMALDALDRARDAIEGEALRYANLSYGKQQLERTITYLVEMWELKRTYDEKEEAREQALVNNGFATPAPTEPRIETSAHAGRNSFDAPEVEKKRLLIRPLVEQRIDDLKQLARDHLTAAGLSVNLVSLFEPNPDDVMVSIAKVVDSLKRIGKAAQWFDSYCTVMTTLRSDGSMKANAYLGDDL